MSPLPSPPRLGNTIIHINPKPKLVKDLSSAKRITEMDHQTHPKSKKPKASGKKPATAKKKESKTAHSIIEKKRRIKLNREFEMLKILVPACRNSIIGSNYTSTNSNNAIQINDGMYKLTILQATVEYVNYLHELIRLIQKSKKNAVRKSDLRFSQLNLNLDTYRDLNQEFNFIEIMKIFKLMNSFDKQFSQRRKSSKEFEDNNTNLVSNSEFHKYLETKGISSADIESFKSIFEVIETEEQPDSADINIMSKRLSSDKPSQFEPWSSTSSTPAIFKSRGISNDSFWKRPQNSYLPITSFINSSPTTVQGICGASNFGSKDFQLPGPIMELPQPANRSHYRANSSNYSSSFTGSNAGSTENTIGTSADYESVNKKPDTESAEANPELFSLSPNSFSNIFQRFEDPHEHKRAGEALLHMKRNSVDKTSPPLKANDEQQERSISKINTILN